MFKPLERGIYFSEIIRSRSAYALRASDGQGGQNIERLPAVALSEGGRRRLRERARWASERVEENIFRALVYPAPF